MKVFYHNDMDGKCAAHVVNRLEPDDTPTDIFHSINYGMEFPFDSIEDEEVIYILDYSIEPEEMSKLLAITPNVIWIDHHKTAIEKYEGFEWEIGSRGQKAIARTKDIRGIRDTAFSGCELTWEYFKNFSYLTKDECPEYVRLVGDRDTWTWEYGDRTKFFYAGIEAEDMYPTSRMWGILQSDGRRAVDQVVQAGTYIQRYKDRTQQEYIKENGFWVEFHDHKCYAACGMFSSQPFEAVVPEADIWLTFRYMPDGYWTILLYSTKLDVSEIAKQYEYQGKRGGGHTGAAGFQCAYPPFLPDPMFA